MNYASFAFFCCCRFETKSCLSVCLFATFKANKAGIFEKEQLKCCCIFFPTLFNANNRNDNDVDEDDENVRPPTYMKNSASNGGSCYNEAVAERISEYDCQVFGNQF